MSDNQKTDYNKVETSKKVIKKVEDDININDRKKLDPLLDVVPKKRKRSLMGRLVSGILGPDGLPGIGSYVSEEIIVPAIKNIIVDAVTSGINMVMYGESRSQGRVNRVDYRSNYNRYNTHRPTTNYTSRYTSEAPEPVYMDNRSYGRARQGVQEYEIPDRVDAAQILATLSESADMYGTVSVADYYDLIGAPVEYTDHNRGWDLASISRAVIRPVRGGYVINFPPPEVL